MKVLSGRGLPRAATILVLALAGVVVVMPLLFLMATSWVEGRGRLGQVLTEPGFRLAVAHSLELAAAATVLSVPVGVALALALRDPKVPGRHLWIVAIMLPVLIPDFVMAYSWLRAYATAGLTTELFGFSWAQLQGPVGVTVVVAANAVPLAYLVVTVGIATRAEPTTECAARMCGATPFTVLRTITLPLLRPAIATAGVLIFVLSLGTFAVPEVMGTPAGFSTVTTQIYADLALGSDQASFVDAITLAMLLVVLTLVIVVPADLVLGVRLQISRAAATDVGWPPRARAPRFVVAIAMTLYLTLTTGLPLLALLSAALTRAVGVRSTPANWTLDNFVAVLTPRTGEAIGRSLVLALAAASILLLLGGCTAALGRTRSGRGVGVLVALTLVLPGSTLAIGMLISYGRWLADTTAIILVAYVAKLWAIAHRPIAAALDRVPGGELRAARVSGANLPIALATVVVPRLRTALITAWGLCFLTALHEVTMSSLLYGPGNETLAVVVLNSADLGRIGVTAALSVVVTALVLIPATAVWVLGRRTARG